MLLPIFYRSSTNAVWHHFQVDERRDSIPEEPETQPLDIKLSKLAVPENNAIHKEENNGTVASGTIGWKNNIPEVENT